MLKRMLARIELLVLLAMIALVSFTATAFAATAAAGDDGSLLDLLRPVFDAITHGQYYLGVALALVFLCTLARRYGSERFPFLATKMGAAALVLVGSFGGALATGLAAIGTNALSWALVLGASQVALAAAGGYSLLSNLLVDPLLASDWYKTRAPAWFKTLMSVVMWAFTKPDAVKTAEAAGDAAVKAAPAQGLEATTGKPTEVK